MDNDEKGQRTNRILDAAIACMLDNRTDLQAAQVAVRAGISTRTLNRYYPNRDRLMFDAAVRYLESRNDSILLRYQSLDMTGLNGRERLLRFLRAQVAYYEQDIKETAAYVAINLYCVYISSSKNFRRPGFDGRIMRLIIDGLEAGIGDGSIRRSLDPQLTGTLIAANFNGVMQRIAFQQVSEPGGDATAGLRLLHEYLSMLELYLRPSDTPTV